jgi:hypothetical protein
MRILILTHERSGGFSLTNWISNELNVDMYHEPFNSMLIDSNIFDNPNCVIKIFPKIPTDLNIKIPNFIESFDKVIIHKRKNLIDTSISLAHIKKTQSDTNVSYHNTYEVDDNWLKNNDVLINEQLKSIKNFDKDIENLEFKNYINTTYEGVFNTQEDIDKIKKFLNLKDELKWLDWIDNKRRLRGGKFGINGVKIKKKLI